MTGPTWGLLLAGRTGTLAMSIRKSLSGCRAPCARLLLTQSGLTKCTPLGRAWLPSLRTCRHVAQLSAQASCCLGEAWECMTAGWVHACDMTCSWLPESFAAICCMLRFLSAMTWVVSARTVSTTSAPASLALQTKQTWIARSRRQHACAVPAAMLVQHLCMVDSMNLLAQKTILTPPNSAAACASSTAGLQLSGPAWAVRPA